MQTHISEVGRVMGGGVDDAEPSGGAGSRRQQRASNSAAGSGAAAPPPPPPPVLKCPRCDSSNTKFCYYNNYSLSQPRHFCKHCRRYWTHGGSLRNVPIGGGCRKNKRSVAAAAKHRSSVAISGADAANFDLLHHPSVAGFADHGAPSISASFHANTVTAMLPPHLFLNHPFDAGASAFHHDYSLFHNGGSGAAGAPQPYQQMMNPPPPPPPHSFMNLEDVDYKNQPPPLISGRYGSAPANYDTIAGGADQYHQQLLTMAFCRLQESLRSNSGNIINQDPNPNPNALQLMESLMSPKCSGGGTLMNMASDVGQDFMDHNNNNSSSATATLASLEDQLSGFNCGTPSTANSGGNLSSTTAREAAQERRQRPVGGSGAAAESLVGLHLGSSASDQHGHFSSGSAAFSGGDQHRQFSGGSAAASGGGGGSEQHHQFSGGSAAAISGAASENHGQHHQFGGGGVESQSFWSASPWSSVDHALQLQSTTTSLS